MSKKCSLKIFDGEKTLHGTAAVNHHISKCGGWDKFNENLVKSITIKATEKLVPVIYEEIIKELGKPILKLVK